MNVDEVAQALYVTLPADFVGARTAYAKEARADGDASSARRIGRLRKPTKSAWATNLLVRADPGRLDALQALGAELRSAQDRLAGAELRALASRRRDLVADLVAEARRLADEAGDPLGGPGADEVAQTLNAALTDAAAAAALDTGLLVDALVATGLEPVELDGKVALPESVGEVAERPRRAPSPTQPAPTRKARPRKAPPEKKKPARREEPEERVEDTAAEKAAAKAEEKAAARAAEERRRAERRRSDAEDRLVAARRAIEQAEQQTTSARGALDDLEQRRTALQDELARLDHDIAAAQRDVREARQARTAAERAEAKAQRAIDRLP